MGKVAAEETGALAGIPVTLPALTRALKLQAKAGKVGFDWNDPLAVLAKIREEADEIEAELACRQPRGGRRRGRRSAVRGGQPRPPPRRRSGRRCCARPIDKFERRFGGDRTGARRRGKTPQEATLKEMDALWDAAKASGKIAGWIRRYRRGRPDRSGSPRCAWHPVLRRWSW